MKRFRSAWDIFGISENSVIFRVVAYSVFFAVILCGGCSDDGIGTAVGEAKLPSIPSATSNLSAKATSSSVITVSWSSVSKATGYNVYRSDSANGSYLKVGDTTSTSYTNTKLSSGTNYYYKVSAYNRGGESSLSSYIPATTIPDAPSIDSATTESPGNITVSWSSVFGAAGYKVYRCASADGVYTQVGTTSSASTSYTNTGLSSGATYYYKVSAYNSAGESSQSQYVKATTAITDVPSVSATAMSSSSIAVSWSSVSGAIGYYVYRDTDADGIYSKVETTSSKSYTDTELLSGTTYYYKVSAYNNTGEGSLSQYASATTPLSPPLGVSAVAVSASGITVSWFSVSQATGYNLYRSTRADGTYDKVATTSSTSYTNSGLSPCTTYYYKVSAYNSSLEGTMSPYIEATPLIGPLSISANAVSSSSITVSWSHVCGAEGYYVYRSAGGYDTYKQVRATSSTSYTDVGLPSDEIYCYTVSAYNSSVGEITKSSEACATTSSTGEVVGTFTDYRDGKTYNTVRVGDYQIWMAENLNYEISGESWCYDNDESNCDKYGRLYNWVTAMDIDAYYYSSVWGNDAYHQGICPDGWHLPSRQDWGYLARFAGGTGTYGSGGTAGTKLKSDTDWNSSSGTPKGTDNYGISALPGGYSSFYGEKFSNAGTIGYWWTASEDNSGKAYYRSIRYNGEGVAEDVNDKSIGMSVRCVQE